ncbi:unnamed protein product [Arctogadus glacialis]
MIFYIKTHIICKPDEVRESEQSVARAVGVSMCVRTHNALKLEIRDGGRILDQTNVLNRALSKRKGRKESEARGGISSELRGLEGAVGSSVWFSMECGHCSSRF